MVLVSRGGGFLPRWSKNGQELVHLRRELLIATEIALHRDTLVQNWSAEFAKDKR